jgi:hypothetical protein
VVFKFKPCPKWKCGTSLVSLRFNGNLGGCFTTFSEFDLLPNLAGEEEQDIFSVGLNLAENSSPLSFALMSFA